MAQTVETFLDAMEHPRRAEIDELRAAIRAAGERSAEVWNESVKWNAPSFALAGGQHFLTFRIRPGGVVQIVLHTGATKAERPAQIAVHDPAGLLVWAGADRATIAFADAAETTARRAEVARIAAAWAAQLPPGVGD